MLLLSLLAVMLVSGPASAAPGDPYVVYTANSFASGAVILRTDPASGSLTEVSRNGLQGTLFQRPYDLAVERDGNLVVADMGVPNSEDGAVIRVDPLTGRQSLVSSGGEFYDPVGIAVAPDGQLYVVDNKARDNAGAVIRVDPLTGAQTLVTERTDQDDRDELDLPFGIALEGDGDLVVANRVVPGLIPPTCQPLGKVVRVDPVTGVQQELPGQPGQIAWPLGLAVAADGEIVVANECPVAGGLIGLDAAGRGQREITPNGPQDVLVTPERIAFDPGGALVVSDFSLGPDEDGGIVRVDPEDGSQSLVRAGELFNHPLGIATVVNHPPSATLTPDPPVVAAGRPVRLDASGSGDPDGLPLAFDWDLDGDGAFEAGSGATATVARSFESHGRATVRVRVNDPHGGRAVAEASVLVDGAAPLITGLRSGARVLGVRQPARSRGERRGDRTGHGPARARRRPPRATTIRFNLSEPATVTLVVERARRGRRTQAGAPCRVRARRGRRCVRWSPTRLVRHGGGAGANAVLLRARGLRPGRYRLLLRAVDGVGNASAQRRLPLRIVRLRARPRSEPRASGRPSPRPRWTSPLPSSRPPGPACRRPCRPLTPSSLETGCRPC
jgi:sugar lactone lactonase YvrE